MKCPGTTRAKWNRPTLLDSCCSLPRRRVACCVHCYWTLLVAHLFSSASSTTLFLLLMPLTTTMLVTGSTATAAAAAAASSSSFGSSMFRYFLGYHRSSFLIGGVTAFQPSFTVTKRTTTGAAATKPSILFSSKVTTPARSSSPTPPVRTWKTTPKNNCGNFQRIRNVNYYQCSGSSESSTTALLMGRRSSRRNKKNTKDEDDDYTPRVMQLPEDGGLTPEIAQVYPARYEELLQAKVDVMESLLHQAVSSSTSVLPPTEVFPSPKVGYRMRANFKLWRTGGKFDTKKEDDAAAEEEYEPTQVHYVMFAKGSRIPIKVTKYPMGSDLLQQLLDPIQQGLEATPILHTRINDIRFLTTLVGDILITITYNRPLLHDNHTNSDDTDNATASETAENNPWSRAVQTELIAPIVQAKTLLGPNNTITIVGRSKKVKLIVTGGKNQETNTGNPEEVQVGSDNNDDDDTNSTTSVDTTSSSSTSSSSSVVADEATVREILHVPMSVASHNNSNNTTTKEFRYTQTEGAFSQPNAIVCQSMLGWAYDVTRPPTSDATTATDSTTTDVTTNAARNDYDLCELYCGNGCFTVVLASNFRYVVATEMNKASVQLAKDNLVLNGITNVKVAKLNAEDFVLAYEHQKQFRRLTDAGIEIVLRYNHNKKKDDDDTAYANETAEDTTTTTNSKTTTPKSHTIQFDKLHTLFVDPPRAGLDATCRSLAAKFERIVYISCNPETMVRDVQELLPTHDILRVAAFDQFPYTPHLEAGIVLQRKESMLQ